MKLYVIEAEEGKCKIGVSSNPLKRLAQLEGAGGFSAKSFFYTDMVSCEGAERRLLDIFSEDRIYTSTNTKSEWVNEDFHAVLIEAVKLKYSLRLHLSHDIDLAVGYGDGDDFYETAHYTELTVNYDQTSDFALYCDESCAAYGESSALLRIFAGTLNKVLSLSEEPLETYQLNAIYRLILKLKYIEQTTENIERTLTSHAIAKLQETPA